MKSIFHIFIISFFVSLSFSEDEAVTKDADGDWNVGEFEFKAVVENQHQVAGVDLLLGSLGLQGQKTVLRRQIAA